MSKILTDLSFLEKGKPFPPADETVRLERYKNNRLLFDDEHAEVYKEQFKRIERVIGNFNDIVSYGVVFNYQKLMSLKIADFVFGTPPDITVSDDKKQAVIEKIIFDTDFFNKLYISAIDISRYGDSILQVSEKNSKAKIDVTSPKYWFPVVNNDNIKEFMYHVFAWKYIIDSKNKKYGLAVQIHKPDEPNVCEIHRYEYNGCNIGNEISGTSKEQIEKTFDVCPIFIISNIPTSDSCFGIDDYASVDSIISELIIRVSQVCKVLDKFSSPSMSGPQSAMQFNQQSGQWELRMGDFFARNGDDPEPKMITWDANMEANFKVIEFLTNQLYTISEMGSAVFGDLSHSTGTVASGTALRRLMISPLAKARRISRQYDTAIKNIISLCAKIYGTNIEPTEISIKWHDGLPSDPKEEAEIMNIRTGSKATLSRYTAIRRMDNLSDSDTDVEMKLIEADEINDTFGNVPVNEPESVVVDE